MSIVWEHKPSAEQAELERLRLVSMARGDAVYQHDLSTGCMTWSGDLVGLFGPSGAPGIGSLDGFETMILADDVERRRRALLRHVSHGERFDCDYRLKRTDGEPCWVNEQASLRPGQGGLPDQLIGSLQPITVRKLRESRLERLAGTDALTGQLSRARLLELADQTIARLLRSGTTGGLLIIGIDHASRITEAFGIDGVDTVLRALGDRLTLLSRADDQLGRVGNFQFGLLVENASATDIVSRAEEILSAVRGNVVETSAGPVPATVSVGAVWLPAYAGNGAEALGRAEEALSQAKRSGRDRVAEYLPSAKRDGMRERNRDVAEAVLAALRDDRFRLAFQPIIDISTGRAVHHEALIRMIDAKGNAVRAARFIPVAEQLGLARLIDRRALDLALGELQRHRKIRLTVNVSSLTTNDVTWLRVLQTATQGHPELADRLTVEITETMALHGFEETAGFVAAVRDLGCHVALDDFGAGYTSFRHLRALPIDMVKIDGSFIRDLSRRPENQSVVRAIIELTRALKLTAVAECVENAEDAKILIDQGLSLLQGYHFGAPTMEPRWAQARGAAPRGQVFAGD